MVFQKAFLSMMSDIVVREPFLGSDKNGQPQFGSPQSIRARVVSKETILRRAGSLDVETEVVSKATVYCSGVTTINWSTNDRITLPNGSQPAILDIRVYPDGDGIHHETVFV